MTPETQDKLVKLLGLIVQAGIVIACVRLLPDNPEVLAIVTSITGAAYGAVGYNTPITAVRKAKGLVSVKAPSKDDTAKMREAVAKADSMQPPAAGAQS